MDAILNPAAARHPCASVEDVQLQLRGLLASKVSPTKAEHITATFEIQSTAVFHVNESDASQAGQNLDPSLGGLPVLPSGQVTREIVANDTLVSQPQDTPTLQKLVCRHIITALEDADQSSWTVRQVSRTSSGWTFTYICKDSTQAWLRQNAKNKDRPVIGASSQKDDQDPVNLSRPAFDCRGSITIAFVRSTRTIHVKYDHTPFHRTVSQLLEYYAPPPPPAPVPKRPADSGPGASGKKRKKSQAVDGAPSAEGTPSKRKKKDKNAVATATPGDAPANPVTLPDDSNLIMGLSMASEAPSATPTKRTPKPRKPRASKAGSGRKSAGNDAVPDTEQTSSEAPVGGQSEAAQSGQAGPAPNSALNLPPGEAARRREVATNLLRQNGVDPATLSDEQFNIFANQSPKYQQESLQMLVKYGAERLRVVHPTSSSGTPAPANGQASQTNEATAGASTGVVSASAGTKANVTATSASKPRAKPKQTRGNCDGCKTRKVKCSRQKPSCSECIEKGLQCYYPPPRVRNKSSGAADIIQDELDESNLSMQEQEQEQEQETSDLGSPGFGTSNQASTDPVSPSFDQSDTYGQVSHSSFPSITTDTTHFPNGAQAVVAPGSEIDYSQASSHTGTQQSDSYYQPQAASTTVYPDPVSSSSVGTAQATAGEDRSSSRRSLPSVPRTQKQASYSSTQDSTPSSWQTLPTPTSQASSASKQSRSRKSAPTSTYDSGQAYEGLQQAAALSQAAAQQPARQSPVARNASPFQTHSSRTKSRQGHRSQQSSSNAASSLYSAPATTDSTSNNTYDSSSLYSTSGNQANVQSSNRIAYEPYSQHPSSTSSITYSSYDNNKSNNRSHTTSSVSISNPVTQSISASYSTSTAPSTNNWATSSNRNTQSYTANHSTTGNSSYNLPSSSTQQSSTLQSFHVRPRSTAPQAKTSSSSYSQQPEQQQFYGSYSSQSHNSANQQTPDWYGITSASNSSNNYRSSSRNSGGGGYGQTTQNNSYHQQQHGHLDGGDQALYDLLRGSSGH